MWKFSAIFPYFGEFRHPPLEVRSCAARAAIDSARGPHRVGGPGSAVLTGGVDNTNSQSESNLPWDSFRE